MNKRRILLMAIAIAASVFCLGFMGLKAFITKIYDSRSCEWANIDNIEMRAKVDIPSTTDCQCEYDNVTETKQAIFTLDKEEIPVNYIKANKLTKVDRYMTIAAQDFSLEKTPNQFTAKNLYFREGKNRSESYKLLYDADAGKIWVNVKYLD